MRFERRRGSERTKGGIRNERLVDAEMEEGLLERAGVGGLFVAGAGCLLRCGSAVFLRRLGGAILPPARVSNFESQISLRARRETVYPEFPWKAWNYYGLKASRELLLLECLMALDTFHIYC